MYRFFTEIVSSEFVDIPRYFSFLSQPNSDVHVYSLLLLKQIVKMAYFNNKVTSTLCFASGGTRSTAQEKL